MSRGMEVGLIGRACTPSSGQNGSRGGAAPPRAPGAPQNLSSARSAAARPARAAAGARELRPPRPAGGARAEAPPLGRVRGGVPAARHQQSIRERRAVGATCWATVPGARAPERSGLTAGRTHARGGEAAGGGCVSSGGGGGGGGLRGRQRHEGRMAESSDKLYRVEYAKSGRASCKKCSESIPKDSLRMAIMVQVRGGRFVRGGFRGRGGGLGGGAAGPGRRAGPGAPLLAAGAEPVGGARRPAVILQEKPGK